MRRDRAGTRHRCGTHPSYGYLFVEAAAIEGIPSPLQTSQGRILRRGYEEGPFMPTCVANASGSCWRLCTRTTRITREACGTIISGNDTSGACYMKTPWAAFIVCAV